MDPDLTQFQSAEDLENAEKLSREGTRPPAEVPGYEIHVLIGSGAYGEVWSGIDRNTGRRVAIKFYSRRSKVDFSLLTREVEKLAALAANRYVVQLLDVGWDATPPFYVMDFIENGSLEDELRRRGSFPVEEATEMFHEVAIGLMHLHNKGILHCDLKPGNVLLDNDHKPRLADFGQSRLSSEQVPALGTLFYMAPEQADLEAIPDARWDVFALGALMYCMLTGAPPYRVPGITEQLESADEMKDRLHRYQQILKLSRPPRAHREMASVDKPLADIIDRCIAVEPNKRYENVQAILLALRQREEARARRPLMMLGLIGPILLLTIMSVFGFVLYNRSMEKADQGLMEKARESNSWAAQFASRTAADEIDKFFSLVHRLSRDKQFLNTFKQVLDDPELKEVREQLADPNATEKNRELIQQFLNDPTRKLLQPYLREQLENSALKDASWFATDAAGTQLAFVSEEDNFGTIGRNYSWRTYFRGDNEDLKRVVDGDVFYPVDADSSKRKHIFRSHLSAIFVSQASGRWKVAFSKPIFENGEFLGIIAATVHCGDLVSFDDRPHQYAMLVDFREGPNRGAILGHPLFDKYTLAKPPLPLPPELVRQTVPAEEVSSSKVFRDPMAQIKDEYPQAADYSGEWILGLHEIKRTIFDPWPVAGPASSFAAESSALEDPVVAKPGTATDLKTEATGLVVLALEDADFVRRPVDDLGRQILVLGFFSVVMIALVGVAIWLLAVRTAKESRRRVNRAFRSPTESLLSEKTGG